MPTEIISILSQLPVVLVFIWYSERVVSSFQRFLKEERDSREKSDEATRLEIRALHDRLIEHDSRVDAKISAASAKTVERISANEKTRPRPKNNE